MSALHGQSVPLRRARVPAEAYPAGAGKKGPSTNPVAIAKRQQNAENNLSLAADMEELFEHVEAQFQRMSDKYDKKVQYFQELFYQRGLHTVHRREKTNAFNTFKSTIAANRREEGLPGLTVAQIAADEDYMKQYHDMTEEERTAMIDEHDKTKDRQTNAIRLSGKARYQDATFVFGQITMLIQGLRDRVGVEGFCVLVPGPVQGMSWLGVWVHPGPGAGERSVHGKLQLSAIKEASTAAPS
ncbi:hypothetical protein BD626DRAFT_575723 [Schizophyllum amplum]|uniref:Uncharacterized protein n=1 Tax=Schizophyllum amplum TaxID=97359 RepID=A0A550BV27_9AGAR|nr:hypothetical protein BD626DRAFT_575723 [Auriculariopsis ampla]